MRTARDGRSRRAAVRRSDRSGGYRRGCRDRWWSRPGRRVQQLRCPRSGYGGCPCPFLLPAGAATDFSLFSYPAAGSSYPVRRHQVSHGGNPGGPAGADCGDHLESAPAAQVHCGASRPEGMHMAEGPSSMGLADVVAASTAISDIDGRACRLFYRGYDINQLAGSSTFEEIAYLLQRGSAPSRGELDGFRAEIAAGAALGKLVTESLWAVGRSQEPMEALRSLVSLASADDPDKDSNDPAPNLRKAARLTAQQPVLVAAYAAARDERDVVGADAALGLAANFLLQLTGVPPSERAAQILDTCLVLHADHTMNASTFAARVCAPTLSDIHY